MSDAGAQQQTLQSWLWTAKGYPLNLPPAGFFLIAVFVAFILVQAYIAVSIAKREHLRLDSEQKDKDS